MWENTYSSYEHDNKCHDDVMIILEAGQNVVIQGDINSDF